MPEPTRQVLQAMWFSWRLTFRLPDQTGRHEIQVFMVSGNWAFGQPDDMLNVAANDLLTSSNRRALGARIHSARDDLLDRHSKWPRSN